MKSRQKYGSGYQLELFCDERGSLESLLQDFALGGAYAGKVQEPCGSYSSPRGPRKSCIYAIITAHDRPEVEELQAFLDQLVEGSRLLERHAGRFLFQLPPLQDGALKTLFFHCFSLFFHRFSLAFRTLWAASSWRWAP